MRRKKASKRGRTIWILAAVGAGYVLGGWNASALRSPESAAAQTPAQAVALRFQEDFSQAPAVQAAAAKSPAVNSPAVAPPMVIGNPRFALFEPEPMEPHRALPLAAAQPAPTQTAELTPAAQTPPVVAAPPPWRTPPRPLAAAKPPAAAARRTNPSRYSLDDAQIVNIRRRLHLTPEQERMWPAVAVALRNVGLERERQARSGRAPDAIDPDSPAVQDLRSAAIPLLMSFSDRQKDEVRNLARNMGLYQLASEF